MKRPIELSGISHYRGELMGLAMLFVMFFHVWMPKSNALYGLVRCGNVGVDMFLFLSGIGLWYSWTKDPSPVRFFKKRYLRVYPAWLVIACLFYMKKRFPVLASSKEERKFDRKRCGTLLSVGLPMGLQYSVTAIGSIIIQRAVNGFDNENVNAGVTAAQRINQFFYIPYDALGATMATFAGQNTGAKQYERLKKGMWDAALIGVIYSLVACAVQYFVVRDLVLLFTDESETEVIDYAYRFVLASGLAGPLLVFVNVVRFSIQGMGFSALAILSGVFEMLARAIAGLALTPVLGFFGICLANPLAWLFADVFLLPAFFLCKHALERHERGGAPVRRFRRATKTL